MLDVLLRSYTERTRRLNMGHEYAGINVLSRVEGANLEVSATGISDARRYNLLCS